MREQEPDVISRNPPPASEAERRWDWLMRQFVDQVLSRKAAKSEVRRALLKRGVPHHVADRVLAPRQPG